MLLIYSTLFYHRQPCLISYGSGAAIRRTFAVPFSPSGTYVVIILSDIRSISSPFSGGGSHYNGKSLDHGRRERHPLLAL